jgi:hypothetical protein
MLTLREYDERVFHVAGGELQIVGGDGGCKSGGPSKLPSKVEARRSRREGYQRSDISDQEARKR